jgi:metal-sulfur cluster biosynthetic enzyme
MTTLLNANPVIFDISTQNLYEDDEVFTSIEENERDYVSREEVFEHIRHLNDPEHPLTLEQLNVVSIENITVTDPGNTVFVQFTPTIPHCSMATLIGLCIRVKLLRSLPSRFKVTVEITPGAHQSEAAVNKQLADKERVAAALENSHLLEVVNKCIVGTDK